jgi:hypothetical protein
MSYDPSQAQGTRAIQIDINGATVLSDDVTSHTITSLTARNKYFIESKYYVPVNSTVSGLILYYTWTGFTWAGATIRCNAVSGTGTMTDDSFIGTNIPGVNIVMSATSTGSATITTATRKMITQLWRII